MLLVSGCSGSFDFKENTDFENENVDKSNSNLQEDSSVDSDEKNSQNRNGEKLDFKLEGLTDKGLEIYSDEEAGLYEIIITESNSDKEICRFYANIDSGNNEIKLGTNCDISNNKLYHVNININGEDYSIEIPGIVLNSNDDIDEESENKDLNAYYNGKSVEIKWDMYSGDDLKYYKVVHSTSNKDLKYPEDGYLTYITNPSETSYEDKEKFQVGTNYYRITTVLNDDTKIHSNVEVLNIGGIQSEEDYSYEGHFESYDKGEYVLLEWEAYKGDNFKYYKVVHSTTDSDPKYPEDGYIQVITNPSETTYKDYGKFEIGVKNYYRITTVLNDDSKIHSNVDYIFREILEEVVEPIEDEYVEDLVCDEEDFDGTISLGEGEIYFGEQGYYNISLEVVRENEVVVNIGTQTLELSQCGDSWNFFDLVEIQLIEAVPSSNDAVKGYAKFAINYLSSIDVGEQSQEEITTDLEVVQVYASGTSDGVISAADPITLVVRLGSGSAPIKLEDLFIKMDTINGSQTLSCNGVDGVGNATNTLYNVNYISNGGAANVDYISTGDLAEVTFLKDANAIGEGETATLRLLTKNGAVKPIDLTTPSAMTQATTYLFP